MCYAFSRNSSRIIQSYQLLKNTVTLSRLSPLSSPKLFANFEESLESLEKEFERKIRNVSKNRLKFLNKCLNILSPTCINKRKQLITSREKETYPRIEISNKHIAYTTIRIEGMDGTRNKFNDDSSTNQEQDLSFVVYTSRSP